MYGFCQIAFWGQRSGFWRAIIKGEGRSKKEEVGKKWEEKWKLKGELEEFSVVVATSGRAFS